ncbi:MAG: 4Fe-4S binding protein [Actinomycetota bacterium]|nr:4Fe-4S binding protein [Actinomycetota bacterium]
MSSRGVDLTRARVVGSLADRVLRWRALQFFVILPNEVLFWIVILTGLIGGVFLHQSHVSKTVHFGTGASSGISSGTGAHAGWLFNTPLVDTWARPNFSTAITWWLWWSLVWVLMAVVGRGWCMVCPFGGAAEWVQRLSFWKRRDRSLGLGLRWPRSLVRLGILPAVAAFILLTWVEEYYNISVSADPFTTGVLVGVIIILALGMHLVFERRTFCAYLCPLTAVFAPLGATGVVAGFRARDPERCYTCETKDCMRGGEKGYECPWYEWPATASSNASCGLCTECYKACPYDNVGLFVERPFTSVIAPGKRRYDIAIAAVAILGAIVFMTLNALPVYTSIDAKLDAWLSFPHYPNPVDYFGIIAAVIGLFAVLVWFVRFASSPKRSPGSFSRWFIPLAYGIIPLATADLLANRAPTLLFYGPRMIQVISDPFGRGWNLFGTAHLAIARSHLVSFNFQGRSAAALAVQIGILALGAAAALWSTHRIFASDLRSESGRPILGEVSALCVIAACGTLIAWSYILLAGMAT